MGFQNAGANALGLGNLAVSVRLREKSEESGRLGGGRSLGDFALGNIFQKSTVAGIREPPTS
jgi:hypothetical protein